jgi:hypothetical protein
VAGLPDDEQAGLGVLSGHGGAHAGRPSPVAQREGQSARPAFVVKADHVAGLAQDRVSLADQLLGL